MDTSSDEYRMLCLARHVCALETKQARIDFMDNWRKRHGDTSADKLRELCMTEWKKQER